MALGPYLTRKVENAYRDATCNRRRADAMEAEAARLRLEANTLEKAAEYLMKREATTV